MAPTTSDMGSVRARRAASPMPRRGADTKESTKFVKETVHDSDVSQAPVIASKGRLQIKKVAEKLIPSVIFSVVAVIMSLSSLLCIYFCKLDVPRGVFILLVAFLSYMVIACFVMMGLTLLAARRSTNSDKIP